jgi:ABC-type uncharacterized transport system ATPase subunit
MALSSFLTALGGTFYAQYFAYIDPTITFGPAVSIQGLLQAIVGGAGTVLGPLLGSFVLTPLSELSRAAIRGRAGGRDGVRAGPHPRHLVPAQRPHGVGEAAARVMADGMLLEMDGVTKRFGGLTAVNRFSLGVGAGEIVGLIGPNGAGKTTVFHLLSGFHPPTEGAIRFKGASIVGASRTHLPARAGPDVSDRAAVREPHDAGKRHGRRVQSHQRGDRRARPCRRGARLRRPRRPSRRAGPRVTLPDRKRLEMARGLATRPELLLLDEVMSGLNPPRSRRSSASSGASTRRA